MTDFSFITSTSSVLVTLASKIADISWSEHWIPREMTSEKRAQKFHTDDAFIGYYSDLSSASRGTTNQKHYPNLDSDASSVWNFCARFSRGNQRWRREMSAVFLGYTNPRSLNGTSNSTCPWVIPSTLSMKLLNTAFNLCRNSRSA